MLNTKSLTMLGAATLVVAGVAALTMRSRESSEHTSGESAKLFPDLERELNDVATVTIKKKDGEYTLKKNGDAWGLVEKKDYAVDVEPLRKTLIGLAEATEIEAKTADKDRYAKLGVEDPDAADSTSTLITLKDAGGKVLASLVVGKAHEGKSFGSNEHYVRKPGEAQSWLVKASLDLKEKSVDWLDKKILEVKRDRVRSVEVKHADGEIVHVDREKPEDTNFTLQNIPDGKELTYPTAAAGMSSALEWVNFEDVVPANDVDFKTAPGPVCKFTTFDGLTVTVTTKDDKEKTYARFEAAYEPPPDTVGPKPEEKKDEPSADKKDDKEGKKAEKKSPDEVKKEVADLNSKLAPWVFVIPSYNKANFTKHMSDLVKDKAPPPPPPGSQPAPNADGKTGDGAAKPPDKDVYQIPDNLPPEIQKQIREHQESLGHKTVVVPAKSPAAPAADGKPTDGNPADGKPADASTPEAKPADVKPGDKKPDEGKSSDPKPSDDKPKDSQTPPHAR